MVQDQLNEISREELQILKDKASLYDKQKQVKVNDDPIVKPVPQDLKQVVTTNEEEDTYECEKCHAELQQGVAHCPSCGEPLIWE